MNNYDKSETINYELENWGINKLLSKFPARVTVNTIEDLDGVDLVYENKQIDVKVLRNRDNIALSIYRKNSQGIWYSVFPSKSADVIWYCIQKPDNKMVVYEIDKHHMNNIIADLAKLKLLHLTDVKKYGREQLCVFIPFEDRYCKLFAYI